MYFSHDKRSFRKWCLRDASNKNTPHSYKVQTVEAWGGALGPSTIWWTIRWLSGDQFICWSVLIISFLSREKAIFYSSQVSNPRQSLLENNRPGGYIWGDHKKMFKTPTGPGLCYPSWSGRQWLTPHKKPRLMNTALGCHWRMHVTWHREVTIQPDLSSKEKRKTGNERIKPIRSFVYIIIARYLCSCYCSCSSYRLFERQSSLHTVRGGTFEFCGARKSSAWATVDYWAIVDYWPRLRVQRCINVTISDCDPLRSGLHTAV